MMIKNALIVTFSYNFKKGKEVNVQKNNAEQEGSRMPGLF